MKAKHDSQLWEQEQIAKATSFTAFLFNGAGQRHRVDCATLSEAELAAERLERDHATFGRRACVYAIVGTFTVMVPRKPGPSLGSAGPRK